MTLPERSVAKQRHGGRSRPGLPGVLGARVIIFYVSRIGIELSNAYLLLDVHCVKCSKILVLRKALAHRTQ